MPSGCIILHACRPFPSGRRDGGTVQQIWHARPLKGSADFQNVTTHDGIRRPLQRSSVLDLLDRPSGLKETACRHEGCSLMASGLKVLDVGTQGPALKATGVATSPDKSRQGQTSPDKSRQVATSCDQLGRTPSEGPRTFKTVSEGPGTFRMQHQTTRTPSYTVPGPQGSLGGSWDLPETASDRQNRYQND